MSVDWELLADHLGGALAGTPQEAQVAQLIATDEAWARAADELTQAVAAVQVRLRTLPAEPMPAEVCHKLDRWLQEFTPASPPPDRPELEAEPEPAGAVPAEVTAGAAATGAHRSGAVPAPRRSGRRADERRRPPSRAGRPRRLRLSRWGAGAAAAAGVMAFAALGLGSWAAPDRSVAEGEGAAAPSTLDAEPARELAIEPAFAASGADYRPDPQALIPPEQVLPAPELIEEPAVPADEDDARQPGPGLATDNGTLLTVPPALARLWTDPAARSDCLRLVAQAVQPSPGIIDVVDFAHFQGQPAIVIWVTASDGTRSAWIVGPACGASDAGPDLQFQTQLS